MSANNSVNVLGRLTKDVEVKKTQSGRSVASFCVAIDNGKDKSGAQKPAYFIDMVAWEKTSELIGQFCRKGDLVSFSGELQTRTYDRSDGTKAKVTEVLVRDFRNTTPKAGTVATLNQQSQQQQQYYDQSYPETFSEDNLF